LLAYGFVFVILLFLLNLLLFLLKISKRKFYAHRLSKAGITEIDKMDGIQFEHYLKLLFKELGYKSSVTKASYDFGADLILQKEKKKIVVQAKRYNQKNVVGIDAVQQVFAAKAYYQADESWIITTSSYSPSATKLAAACNVRTLDRVELVSFIIMINPETKAADVMKTIAPQEVPCPKCGGNLIVRVRKSSQEKFLGCSNFPACRQTAAYVTVSDSTS
jgi:restriction system protein